MTLFGRELTLEQLIGFVKCNAAPTEDLVHMAALELIAALQDAQRRADAAVEDLCGACESLTRATGHGWEDGCYNCQWWRGVKEEMK